MSDPRKEFKIRLTEDEWEEVRRVLFERKKKQQEAGHAALFAWVRNTLLSDGAAADLVLNSPKLPNREPTYLYPEENRIWHDRLEVILDDPKQRNGIEWNLCWGYNNITGQNVMPSDAEGEACPLGAAPQGERRMNAVREVGPGATVIEITLRPDVGASPPATEWPWKRPPCPCVRDIRSRRLPCEEGMGCPE